VGDILAPVQVGTSGAAPRGVQGSKLPASHF